MSGVYENVQGATQPSLEIDLTVVGVPLPIPDDALLRLRWLKPDGTSVLVPLQAVDLAAGRTARVWDPGDTDLVGIHRGQVVLTRSSGDQVFPSDGTYVRWIIWPKIPTTANAIEVQGTVNEQLAAASISAAAIVPIAGQLARALAPATLASSNSAPMTLVAIIGQSQAVGTGDPASLSTNDAHYANAYPNVNYFFHCDGNTDPPVYTTYSEQALQPVIFPVPGSAVRFGLEMSCMETLDVSYPGQWACAKFALSSTSVASAWIPSSTYPTGQTPNLIGQWTAYMLTAAAAVQATRIVVIHDAGHNDAGGSGTAAAYQTNITNLYAYIRAQFAASGYNNVPIVVGRMNSGEAVSGLVPFMTTVQAAQAAYVASDPNSVLVNEDSVALSSDNVHYDGPGEVAVGYLFAKGVAAVLGIDIRPVANWTDVINVLHVDFTDASTDLDGTIASRHWDFGDGNTSTLTNPSHDYASGGTYSVSLTVIDNNGATDTKTLPVTVSAASWHVDATRQVVVLQTLSEANAFLASFGDNAGGPSSLYLPGRAASGNITDIISGLDLVASGTGLVYAQTIPGWTEHGLHFTDNGTGTCATTSASQTDMSVADELVFMWVRTTLAGLRSVVSIGTPVANKVEVEISSTPRWFFVNGANNATSAGSPISTNVYLLAMQSSHTDSSQIMFTPTEKIVGTYSGTPVGKRFGIGAWARASAEMDVLQVMRFSGAAARRTSGQIKTIFQNMYQPSGISIPWS